MDERTDLQSAERRILIIDDNPDILKDFSSILISESYSELESLENELFGYETKGDVWKPLQFQLEFANQGQIGLQKVQSAVDQHKPYHLAFVDMRMPPGWDGLKTIRELWRVDQDLQIVLCTAYSDYTWEEINVQLQRTDNLLVLKKPFDSTEVYQLASSLTEKWLLARQAKMKQIELEKMVSRRTRELQVKNSQLQDEIEKRKSLETQLIKTKKMEAIGTLAAGVAHDLNNILSGILTYPDLLLLNISREDPMHRPLSLIKQSGYKAAAIVQDMLMIARHNVVSKKTIDLASLVTTFLSSPECGVILKNNDNSAIEKCIRDPLPLVHGSAIHLEKLVMNLVANAAESMERAGSILIGLTSVTLKDSLPGYDAVSPGKYVKLVVADQGKGIESEDIEHIFEPFFTKKKLGFSGTGLGMTVVWETVSDHDGYIVVESTVGRGTTICVYLPALEKGIVQQEMNLENMPVYGKGERVLIVDDVDEQREIATEIFTQLGFRAESVSSGELAVDYLKRKPVELVLLDMVMDPGMDGLETLKQIYSIEPNQKVIIASGYTNSSRIRSALNLGAVFLHKPYEIKEIAARVEESIIA